LRNRQLRLRPSAPLPAHEPRRVSRKVSIRNFRGPAHDHSCATPRCGRSYGGELPEIQQWWKDHVKGDPQDYERDVIEAFGTEGAPDLLIVVDKMLTGFDDPLRAAANRQ
jgi:hypothetical protein